MTMAKNNRIQQPYGYRDNGEYSSEANMLCNAISSLGKGDIGELGTKAFFGVEYRDDLEAFVFLNSGGTPVATADMKDVKFSKLIESSSYNSETKNIDINFENGDTVSISTDGIVPFTAFKDGLEKSDDTVKVKIDPTSDDYLSLSEDGVKVSGIKENVTSIKSLINDEISNRESGDTALSERIDSEEKIRKEGDKKIWDAIGDVSSSITSGDTSLINMIEDEVSKREEGDSNMKELLDAESSAREKSDSEIKSLIGSLSSSVTSGSTSLVDLINKETANRENGDNEIKKLIGEVSSSLTSGQTSVVDMIKAEEAKREEGDSNSKVLISEEADERKAAILEEAKARESSDNELKTKIDDEVSSRKKTDEKLEQEIEDRSNADTEINNKIDALEASNLLDIVGVEKITSGLPQTIRESYKFKKADGSYLQQTVDIYKDSSLINVVLKDIDNKKFLVFTYILEDGTQKDIQVDVEELLIESEFKEGLSASSDGNVIRVRVKIDPSSDKYLSVSSDGIKISGVTESFNAVNESITELKVKLAETDANVSLKADKSYVDTELSKKATVDNLNVLSDSVSKKANTTDVNEELAKKANISYVDDELAKKAVKSDVDSELQLKANASDLVSETTARENEYSTLSKKIDDEKSSREKGDNALDERLTSIENDRSVLVHTVSPIDNSVSVEASDVSNPKVGVKISSQSKDTTHKNNITLNVDGIFSVADLDYDEDRNLLTFVNNDKTLPIYLKSISSIESISYNSDSKKLSVVYTVNGVSKTVDGDLSKLDNTFTVSEATNGALSLSMKDRVISGSVIVNSSHTDNALEMDNNSLYVSKGKLIGDLESKIAELEERIAALETSSHTLDTKVAPIAEENINTTETSKKDSVIDEQDFDLFDME